jgi:N-methylhydantoinase B
MSYRIACSTKSSGAVWTMQIQGKCVDGRPFTSSMLSYSGGMGARATRAGPSATCYPTGIAAVPVEIIEAVTPVIFHRKELRPNSGGDGAVRGGDGQIIPFRLDTRDEWLLNTVTSRVEEGPEGLGGGAPGAPGKFHIKGKSVRDAKKLTMQPADVVLFETPGGAGYGTTPNQLIAYPQSEPGG